MINRNIQNLIFKIYHSRGIKSMLCLGVLLLISCERDDICSESTSTTPNLNIQFFDINNQDASKTVNGLSIRAEGEENYVLFNSDIATAALPLRFSVDGAVTTTRFEISKDSEFFEDDGDDSTNPNTDIVELSYTTNFVYVSRACGYKSTFTNLQITLINDSDNWILNSEVLISNIENDLEQHISFFH